MRTLVYNKRRREVSETENTEQAALSMCAEPSDAEKKFAALLNAELREVLDDPTNLVTRDVHVLMANALTEVGEALCQEVIDLEEKLECDMEDVKGAMAKASDMLSDCVLHADNAASQAEEASSQAEEASGYASSAEEKLSEAKDMLP